MDNPINNNLLMGLSMIVYSEDHAKYIIVNSEEARIQ